MTAISPIKNVSFGTWLLSEPLKKQISLDLKWYKAWANHYYHRGGFFGTPLAAMEIVPILVLSCPALNVITSIALSALCQGRAQSFFDGAMREGNATAAYLMTEQGANGEGTDAKGRTLLDHFATKAARHLITEQDLHICESLLKKGHTGKFKEKDYAHLLDAALCSSRDALALALLENGVSKPSSSWTAFLPKSDNPPLPKWATSPVPEISHPISWKRFQVGENIHKQTSLKPFAKAFISAPILEELMAKTHQSEAPCPVLLCENSFHAKEYLSALSHQMMRDDVPYHLKEKKLIHLDLKVFHELSSREISRLLLKFDKELQQDPNLLFYIDDFSHLDLDSKDLLRIFLTQKIEKWAKEGRIILSMKPGIYTKRFATTPEEKKAFSAIEVPKMTEEQALIVLRRNKEKLEKNLGVIFSSAALESAVFMMRYLKDCLLSETPYQILEEAAFLLRQQDEKGSVKFQNLQTKRNALLLELELCECQNGKASEKRKQMLEEEKKQLEQEIKKIEASDNEELEHKKTYLNIKGQEAYLLSIAKNYDVQGHLDQIRQEMKALQSKAKNIKFEVDRDLVATVVAKKADLPIDRVQGDDVRQLGKTLEEEIIGQSLAVQETADVILRGRVGLRDESRARASFLYAGSTGVGKTEMAKTIARALFGDESHLTRIDMSEFSESHSKSRLIGSPPGYVGYNEGGVLTESLKQNPYQVILFDEVEKAHPAVLTVLLQALDAGRITDGKNHTVDCSNAIFVMTTNLGSQELMKQSKKWSWQHSSNPTQLVEQALSKSAHFPIELRNRLDAIVPFLPLTDEKDLRKIAEKMLAKMALQIQQKHGISIEWSDNVLDILASAGKNPELGARPLKRLIEKAIGTPLAKGIVESEIKEGDAIMIDYSGSNITFTKQDVTDG